MRQQRDTGALTRRLFSLLVVPLVVGGAASEARADELKVEWGGRVQSDLRFQLNTVSLGGFYDLLSQPAGVERNQNIIGLKLKATYGSFTAVAAVDFVADGTKAKLTGFGDLAGIASTAATQPYYFDVQSAYIEVKNLFKGFDLRVGQQQVLWGVGDQFNPTNNLNPDDLRDPLLFGKQLGNFMVKGDYWINDNWSMSGVLVPVFRPALLPTSALIGAAAIDRLPFTDPNFRYLIEAQDGSAAGPTNGYPTVVGSLTPVLPATSLGNMQVSYRLAGTIGEQDVALSYYYGRTDFPVATGENTTQTPGAQCDPANPKSCINGLLVTDVTLTYPRMHVYGLNVSGEFNPLKWISEELHGIGYRVEAALVVPQRTTMNITNADPISLNIGYEAAGTYPYPGGQPPAVVNGTVFPKWVVGLDYNFGSHVYANAQWVHGLLDEYGTGVAVRESSVSSNEVDTAECSLNKNGTTCGEEITHPRIADYLAVGVDTKFAGDKALFRLFTIWDLDGYTENHYNPGTSSRVSTHWAETTSNGFSAVIYPEFEYNFANGLELGGGALIQLGKNYTKFGDPAAGGSVIFTRAKFSF